VSAVLRVEVPGRPVGQGSMRVVAGHALHPPAVAEWRARAAALMAAAAAAQRWERATGPVAVAVREWTPGTTRPGGTVHDWTATETPGLWRTRCGREVSGAAPGPASGPLGVPRVPCASCARLAAAAARHEPPRRGLR